MLCYLICVRWRLFFFLNLLIFCKIIKEKHKFNSKVFAFKCLLREYAGNVDFLKCLNDFCVRMTSLDNKSTIPKHSYCLFKKNWDCSKHIQITESAIQSPLNLHPARRPLYFGILCFTNWHEKFMKFSVFLRHSGTWWYNLKTIDQALIFIDVLKHF